MINKQALQIIEELEDDIVRRGKLIDEAREIIANIKAKQRAGLLPLNDAKDMIHAVIQDVGYQLEIITEPVTESERE